MTEGSSGVTRVRVGPAVDESWTSLRLEPNFRITLVTPDGTVATCTEYVRPQCESSTTRTVQSGFARSIRRNVANDQGKVVLKNLEGQPDAQCPNPNDR